jgi:hypothetical protein
MLMLFSSSASAIEIYGDYVIYLVPYLEGAQLLSLNLLTFEIRYVADTIAVDYVGYRFHRSGDGVYFSYLGSNRLFWTNGTDFAEFSFGLSENSGWTTSPPKAISPTQTAWVGYIGAQGDGISSLGTSLSLRAESFIILRAMYNYSQMLRFARLDYVTPQPTTFQVKLVSATIWGRLWASKTLSFCPHSILRFQ